MNKLVYVVSLLLTFGAVLAQYPNQRQQSRFSQYRGDSGFQPYRPPAPFRTYQPYQQQCDPVAARIDFVPGKNANLRGALFLHQECADGPVRISGKLSGLTPGNHGLHVHQEPNLGNDCSDAKGHYNPFNVNHGAQTNDINNRHVGDLGNIVADYNGDAVVDILDNIISLYPGERNVVRRGMVVHAGEDDLGLGGDEGSLKTGNAGARAGCGVIVPNNSIC